MQVDILFINKNHQFNKIVNELLLHRWTIIFCNPVQ
jgi:hypothetical protein